MEKGKTHGGAGRGEGGGGGGQRGKGRGVVENGTVTGVGSKKRQAVVC